MKALSLAIAIQLAARLTVLAADTNNPAEIRTRRIEPGMAIAAENVVPEVGSEVVYAFFPDVAYTVTVSRVEQVVAGTMVIKSEAIDGRNMTRTH